MNALMNPFSIQSHWISCWFFYHWHQTSRAPITPALASWRSSGTTGRSRWPQMSVILWMHGVSHSLGSWTSLMSLIHNPALFKLHRADVRQLLVQSNTVGPKWQDSSLNSRLFAKCFITSSSTFWLHSNSRHKFSQSCCTGYGWQPFCAPSVLRWSGRWVLTTRWPWKIKPTCLVAGRLAFNFLFSQP